MDLDSYQDEIGGLSRYQVVVIVVTCSIAFGQDITAHAPIFISAVPAFRCTIPDVNVESACNLTEAEIKNFTIPYDGKEYSTCTRYAYNFSTCTNHCAFSCDVDQPDVNTTVCDYGYVYDDDVYGETTVTQFNLVCDQGYLNAISQTLFFFGFFVGSFVVGPLSDWFGRKKAMLIIVSGTVGVGIATAFAESYEVYTFFRFLSGIFISLSALYVYVCELSNTKRRTTVNVIFSNAIALGHTAYAGLAYFIRDWHYLQITIALLPSPMFVMYLFLPESPRWLLANKRNKEARKILERYAKSKGTNLTEITWKRILETEESKNTEDEEATSKIKLWDLFRKPRMRMMCFNVILSWSTASMVYYGLSLNGGNLAGDPYLNNALNAIVEIFAYSAMYITDIVGRRSVLTLAYVMAGLSCISSMLCSLYSNEIESLLTASTAMAITGKFFASLAFTVIYMVTSEIFPTNARTTGLSLGTMSGTVGSMLAPLILQIQTKVPWFAQTVFGVLSIIAGVCSLLYPETSKTEFLTSMDKAEEYYRNHAKSLGCCKKRNKNEDPQFSPGKISDDKVTRL